MPFSMYIYAIMPLKCTNLSTYSIFEEVFLKFFFLAFHMEGNLNCGGQSLHCQGSKVGAMECEPGSGVSSAAKEKPGHGIAVKLLDSAANILKEAYVYRQDIVRCNHSQDMLGVVLEVAGDSDSDDDDVTDVSDIENDECNDSSNNYCGDGGNKEIEAGERNQSLSDGEVRVMWIDGSETTNSLSDIAVVDREFLHGDIVASVSNPTGQLGLVTDVNISVDLLSSTGDIIQNVSSKDLKRVREFTSGDYVVCGTWLGRVDDVLDNVTVSFDDGSLCKVIKANPLRLKPVSKSIIADAGFPYYPGQHVRAASSSVFKTSRWLSGSWKANRLEGTVTKVQAASVFVYWIASASAGTGDNSSADVPSEEQNPKNLALLTCFTHANWQLGDWCLLPTSGLTLSFSTDISTMKNAEDSSRKCRSTMEYARGQGHDDKKFSTECANSPAQRIPILTVDLKGEKELDVTYRSVAQDGDCKCEHSEPSESVASLVSSHLGYDSNANFRTTHNLKEASFPVRESDKRLDQADDSRNLVVHSSSSFGPSKEHAHENCPTYRKKLRKVLFRREKKAHKRDEPFDRAFFIANTITKVDVAWQDGSREFNLESKSLIPMQSPGDHEFFPEQYVVEKVSSENDDASVINVKRVGIIGSVDAKERTANVRWLKPVSSPEEPREFDNEEVVSAYELAEHPDYDYCYGDLVVRLSPLSTVDDDSVFESPVECNDSVGLPQVTNEKRPEKITCRTETLKLETDTNLSNLSWVGHITGLQNGDIEVTWGDGMVSRVGPQAIYVVGREDGESINGGSEVSDDGASWETVEENEMYTLDDADEDAGMCPSTDNTVERDISAAGYSDGNPVDNESLSLPFVALGFLTRLASGFFSRGKKEMDSSCTDENSMRQTESQGMKELSSLRDTMVDEHSSQESDVFDDLNAPTSQDSGQVSSTIAMAAESKEKVMDKLEIHTSEEMDVNDDCQKSSNEHGSCSFEHFDITKEPFDHHFLGENGQSGGRKWAKMVQKEWSILEKNLPDAVFVRVFEDRMDLLRAVIVGACGTPYQDGLFFFDFNLPSEYPQVPPSVYYHSGGLRINPNLYEEGKVCLSLLNTWTGKGNEVWDPNSSSILQVLVSIQGLVLNSRPYFNEAGYEKQVGTAEGEKNSLPYNENTYLLNLRSMLYLLRRPPMHFEDFVKDHFRRRGHYILKACDAYMKGCAVGSLSKDACMIDGNSKQSSSAGFKLMLAKIVPKMYTAFSELGADCHLQKS